MAGGCLIAMSQNTYNLQLEFEKLHRVRYENTFIVSFFKS